MSINDIWFDIWHSYIKMQEEALQRKVDLCPDTKNIMSVSACRTTYYLKIQIQTQIYRHITWFDFYYFMIMNSLPLESKKTIEKLWYIFLTKKKAQHILQQLNLIMTTILAANWLNELFVIRKPLSRFQN